MSFYITGVEMDMQRLQNPHLRIAKGDTASRVSSQYVGVPYKLNFELVVYARNVDDGTHIAEQIFPYLRPDYNITINPIPELGFLKDIPLVFNGVTQNIQYEGAEENATRYVYWTFNFTMMVYYFGPISTPKIIRKVITNIFNDPSLRSGYITRMNLTGGNNGTFKIDDIAYSGTSYETARAYGIVLSWDAGTGKLQLGGVQGQFNINNTIKAAGSNASFTLDSFDASPLKLAKIVIEPDPIDADPESDFGYTTTIQEWGRDYT